MDDWELLRQYSCQGSQEAFAELVRRHLNFVYSSARRQVRSPQLAEEVSQIVFLDLARNASVLKPGGPLTSWLYVVTRRTAQDAVRTESRRQAREHAAYEQSAMSSLPSVWSQVEPLLDEALETLTPSDRSAILLRYFENKPLREVGAALGASEDAAQKRVTRAVEQLRIFISKRGVAVTATGLATTLSASAIEAAPAALGAAISAGAALSASAGLGRVALETTRPLVMTTLQKTALAAGLTFALGASVYEIYLFRQADQGLALLREQTTDVRAQYASLRTANLETSRQLLLAKRQVADAAARLAGGPVTSDPAAEAELNAWLARERRLRQSFEDDPRLKIPELQFLTAKDWTSPAISNNLDSPEAIRTAQAEIRVSAIGRFSIMVGKALLAFADANNGRLPAEVNQLEPYFVPPVSLDVLARYQMTRSGLLYPANERGSPAISPYVIVMTDLVDPDYDFVMQLSPNGGYNQTAPLRYWFDQARAAYSRNNNGRAPTDLSQLEPYLPQPVDLAKLVDQAQRGYTRDNHGRMATEPSQLVPYLPQLVDPAKLTPYFQR